MARKKKRRLGMTPSECAGKLVDAQIAAERACVRIFGEIKGGDHHICVKGARLVGEHWGR